MIKRKDIITKRIQDESNYNEDITRKNISAVWQITGANIDEQVDIDDIRKILLKLIGNLAETTTLFEVFLGNYKADYIPSEFLTKEKVLLEVDFNFYSQYFKT